MAAIAFAATNFFGDDNIVHAAKNCSVRTRYGKFNGFVGKRGVRTWLGIPYAQPPVGELRWRAPQPLQPSDDEFDAKNFGASPIQDVDKVEPASLNRQSEDCLTLNIWTRGDASGKPVMVFIPGGGFVSGGSSDPCYHGANLAAAHEVVVVTINYRLNIFGFMNFSGIDSDFADSGYLGIKDQVAALTWVRENIAYFGGDPDNITIFGESAGASSVMFLSVLPAAKGLFRKVIAQSGHLSFYHTPDHSIKLAEEFMALGGFKNMRELIAKPAEELEQLYEKFYMTRPFIAETDYFPTCDGKYLPEHPFRALKDGAARGIKFLTGNTADEYRYWLLYYDEFLEHLPEFYAKLTPVVYEGEFTNQAEIYRAWQENHAEPDGNENFLEFANQLDWRVGQELAAEYQSTFGDVYFYLFSQKSPVEKLGSCHSIDLPFVFNNPSEGIEPKPAQKFVKQVQATWTSFAATGNPNNDLIPAWEQYTSDNRQTMEINSASWTCHKDLNTQNLTELRHVYEDNLLD